MLAIENLKKTNEATTLLIRREKEGKKIFRCWTCDEYGHHAFTCPKREKIYKGNHKPIKDRGFLYANEEDDSNEQVVSASDDEIGFVDIKEESPTKMAFVSQAEKKFDWIIDSGVGIS